MLRTYFAKSLLLSANHFDIDGLKLKNITHNENVYY